MEETEAKKVIPDVITLARSPKNAFRFYNQRGSCERFIKEGKCAIAWARLSCSRFIPNQVRTALFILAYNLGSHTRRTIFQPAEVAVSEALCSKMLARIHGLGHAPG